MPMSDAGRLVECIEELEWHRLALKTAALEMASMGTENATLQQRVREQAAEIGLLNMRTEELTCQ